VKVVNNTVVLVNVTCEYTGDYGRMNLRMCAQAQYCEKFGFNLLREMWMAACETVLLSGVVWLPQNNWCLDLISQQGTVFHRSCELANSINLVRLPACGVM